MDSLKSERSQHFFDELFEQPFQETRYAHAEVPEKHWLYPKLKTFVEEHNLRKERCLEVGTGYGQFQGLVPNYIGMDIALSAGRYLEKPFINASATQIPFCDESFGFVMSNHVLEHVSQPEAMLSEIWRVLRPGGFLFFTASWQCGPWLAEGYPVRPFSDFDLKGKLIKLSVPVRKTVLFRSLHVFPRRAATALTQLASRRPTRLRYQNLSPSYQKRWMADSTAECCVDPYEVYMWFVSRGARCFNYPTGRAGFFVRTGPLTFQKGGG